MAEPLIIPLPIEMEPYRADLGYFFQTMVRKLHVNRHKGTSNTLSLDALFEGLQGEIAELEVAVAREGQFDAPLEAADVANFGFLIAQTIWHMTREQWEQGQTLSKKPSSPERSWSGPSLCPVCGGTHFMSIEDVKGDQTYICNKCNRVYSKPGEKR